MIDRLSTFSDPEIIELLNKHFVPATDNDWYNRRRKDEVGQFFQSLVKQHPHPSKHHTKQGHYIFTASGKLLGFNNNRDKWNRMKFIKDALAKWDRIPEAEKGPGKVNVSSASDLKLDGKYHSAPPEGSVVLVASSRILKWNTNGGLEECEANDHDHVWGHLAAIDRMWILEDEWMQLLAAGKQGKAIPDRIVKRLARFHLLDFTRGEPVAWKLSEIKESNASIEKISNSSYQLTGKFLCQDGENSKGFEAALKGTIVLDANDRPKQFDVTILGDHWGSGRYTKGARPGRNPLGIAFSLGDRSKPENEIRPQASHWMQSYVEAERQF